MRPRYGLMLVACLALSAVDVQAAPQAPDAAANFAKLFGEWRQLLAKFDQIKQQYQSDPAADKKALEEEFKKNSLKAQAMLPPLIEAGEKAFIAAPNKDKELGDFLMLSLVNYLKTDDYDNAARLAKILVDNHLENDKLNAFAGVAFYGANDFEDAGKCLQLAKDSGVIEQIGLRELRTIDDYKEWWAKEQEIRAAEDRADDLPKVKITTTKGDIVVLLLENEAPNATANFISLVEKGFYDGTPFHRVIPGFMAQGGDPKGDGSGGPGYVIPCECYQDNHRIHFRGSLSMAHAGKDTGGSQFFLTFLPTSHLNGKHTVFGRVIEGFDVLSKLQRIEPGAPVTPDKIVKATVLRKRSHKYKPITRPDNKK